MLSILSRFPRINAGKPDCADPDYRMVHGVSLISLIAGIASSNSVNGMDVRLLCLLCVVFVAVSATGWSLVQRSPIGCVCVCVCHCVWSRNLKNRRPVPGTGLGWCVKKNTVGLSRFKIQELKVCAQTTRTGVLLVLRLVCGRFHKPQPKQRDKPENQICGIRRRNGTSKKDGQVATQFDVKSPNEAFVRNK